MVASSCQTEHYVPECSSPLLPYGACRCLYRSILHTPDNYLVPLLAPCSSMRTVLAAGSRVSGADTSPPADGVFVRPNGSFTETWYSDFTEPEQMPSYTYATTTMIRPSAMVSMAIYQAVLLYSDGLQAGADIAEDYVQGYVADPKGTALNYYQELLGDDDYNDDGSSSGP